MMRTIRTLIVLFLSNVILQPSFAQPVHIPIQHWEDHGAQVYFVQRGELPMVDILVALDAGSARDEEMYGIANLAGSMIDQGTQTLNADQIAEKFAKLAAQFNVSTTRDMTVVGLRSLTKDELLEPAVSLLGQLLGQANFSSLALQRQKNVTFSEIQASKQDPNQLAQDTFMQALYGTHPYAHPVLGNEASVSAITSSDLQKFYHRYYSTNNAVITIVGDLSRSEAEDLVDKIVSRMSKTAKAKALPMAVMPQAKTLHINYPSSQTTVYMGQLGVSRLNPNYLPLILGNYTLGGSMVSQLFTNVRGEHGYSYSVSSYFLPLAANGPFMINLQTKTNNTSKAIELTNRVTSSFINNGPTIKELNAAKANIIGGFPLMLDNNSDIANYLTVIGFYHLPLDYLDTFTTRAEAVNLENVKNALKLNLNMKNFITVTVGQAADVQ
ncbi:MAG: M16 family metallopeptidase [Gammaproteobacteria bacterium]